MVTERRPFQHQERELQYESFVTQSVKAIFTQLAEDTPLSDLRHWNTSATYKRQNNIPDMPQWAEFMRSLTGNERQIITRSLNTANIVTETLKDAKSIPWSTIRTGGDRPIGRKVRRFLSEVFSN